MERIAPILCRSRMFPILMNFLKQGFIDGKFVDFFLISSGQHIICTCRIHLDVCKGWIRFIAVFFFLLCCRQDLTDQVKYFCICGTGNEPVRKMQCRSNRLCAFGFPGSCRTAHHKVTHGMRCSGCFFRVFTDYFDFRRNQIPIWKDWHG